MSELMLAITVLFGWIATVCLHEFGHAIVAYCGGDTTVKAKGYLTLNPLKYTDVGYSLVMPVVFLVMGGIALPGAAVYINRSLLRSKGWQSAVSAAGPLTTAIVAVALSVPFQLGWVTTPLWGWNALALLITLQVAGLFFNLLPVPSFDGFGIIEPWLPRRIQQITQRWGRYGYLVLLALFWTVPTFSRGFWQLVIETTQTLGVPEGMMRSAYGQFSESSKGLFIGLLFGALLYRKLCKSKPQALDQPEDQEKTLSDYNHLVKTHQATPDIWFQRAQTLSSLGQFESALTSYNVALEAQSSKAEIWYSRGVALSQLGRVQEALADFEQAVLLDPRHNSAWTHQARILQEQQNYRASISAYEQSLRIQPANSMGWYEKGKMLLSLGESTEALQSFEKGLKYERENPALWIKYAEVLNKTGQHQRSIHAYEKALRLDSDNIAVLRALGNIQLQLGQIQKALRSYSAALDLNPQDSATLFMRGLTFYSLDQIQSAIRDFELLQALIVAESSQTEQAEALLNLSPALKPTLQQFTPFLNYSGRSKAVSIAQGLLLTLLKRPNEALVLFRNLADQLQSAELRCLEQWVLTQARTH